MDSAKSLRDFARGSSPPLRGLARSEACRAAVVADGAVGSYPAFSPSPMARKAFSGSMLAFARILPTPSPLTLGSLFSVALSVRSSARSASRRPVLQSGPGVTRRCALVSPDFPPPGTSNGLRRRRRGPPPAKEQRTSLAIPSLRGITVWAIPRDKPMQP